MLQSRLEKIHQTKEMKVSTNLYKSLADSNAGNNLDSSVGYIKDVVAPS